MISCDQALDLISESLDAPLSPADRAALDEHLAGCAGCRALLADFNEMEAVFPTLNAPVPPDLTQSVMDRVKAEQVVDLSATRTSRRPWKQWAAAAAVFAVVLLGAGTLGLDQLADRFGGGSTAALPQSGGAITGGADANDAALPESDEAGEAASGTVSSGAKGADPIGSETGDTPVSDGGNVSSGAAGGSQSASPAGGGSASDSGSGGAGQITPPATPVPAPSASPAGLQQARDNPPAPNSAGIEPATAPYFTETQSGALTAGQAMEAVFDALGGYAAYPDAALEEGVLSAGDDSSLVLTDTGLSDNGAYYTFRLERAFPDAARTETVNFYAVPLDGGPVLACRDESLLDGLSPEDPGWADAKAAYDQAVQDYFDTIHN